MQTKIANGESVDLEQLLPRDKNASGLSANEESRVELVTTGGQTYFKLVKNLQINGLRKMKMF